MDKEKVDEAVLALLYLSHWIERPTGQPRSRKALDWDAMERLHTKGLISNPINQNKSVVLSDEGLRKAKQAFDRLFE